MRKALLASLTGAVMALSVPAAATAGEYTLHPNGFGEHSYAAWKAKEGLPDALGGAEQALYFQKQTLTATVAAGVARITGFEGQSPAALGEVAFWWREDGHCGAGAPRFNITTTVVPITFIGCAAMEPSGETTDSRGFKWERRSFDISQIPGEITSISIVFDEGNDVGPGYVYLDNIQVGEKVWTSAADNGNR